MKLVGEEWNTSPERVTTENDLSEKDQIRKRSVNVFRLGKFDNQTWMLKVSN